MRNARFLFAALLVAFLLPVLNGPALAQGGAPDKADLQKMYMDYLKGEGYRPEIDKDGDVMFKHEGLTYFVMLGDVDPGFFRLALANIWPIESEDERVQALVAMNQCNAQAKVAKAYMVGDNVWVAAENFIDEPTDFRGIFERSIRAIQNGADVFARMMKQG